MVLAAGGGTRFAGEHHKLLVPFRGQPLVRWAVEHALGAGLDETIVVQGAVDLADALKGLDVRLVANPAWASGQATSLGVAVDEAGRAGLAAVVVGLGDQPLVPSEAWSAVAGGSAPISVATYDGRRRNPVRLVAAVWPLLSFDGDEGARALMRSRPDLVGEVACTGTAVDIDTLEDLAQWS